MNRATSEQVDAIFPPRRFRTRYAVARGFLFWLAVSLMMAGTAEGQQFELLDTYGTRVGMVDLTRSGLSVRQSVGNPMSYQRAIDYDSADGQFIGFFHRGTARALRFPVTGNGRLFLADLNHSFPSFRGTGRYVRAIVGPPHPWIIHPYGGPWPMTPWVYGYDLAPYLDPSLSGYYGRYPLQRSYLVGSQTVPDPPLPAVDVQLFNDGPRDVQVQVNDLIEPGNRRTMRIPPRTATTVTLQRDAGGQQINRYHVYAGYGEWITRESAVSIPAPIRYEIVVHEWAMQSIAIDRTGKSPNPIEDIQYQGRGLGRFLLPPGDQLRAGTIPVCETAKRQGNQGTVSPILPSENPGSEQLSPLERALQEVQK